MKKFMKKSSLALLLTVLMLLSAITLGSSLFAVSAEETTPVADTPIEAISAEDTMVAESTEDTVTWEIYTKDNTKVAYTHTTTMADGEKLPVWNGKNHWTDENGATVTTHTAGNTKYTAKWWSHTNVNILYYLGSDDTWGFRGSTDIYATFKLTGMNVAPAEGIDANYNKIVLLTDVTLDSTASANDIDGNNWALFATVYGNGYTIKSTSHGGSAPMLYLNNANSRVAFNDVVIDGGVTTTVANGVYSFAGTTYAGTKGAFLSVDAAAEVTFNNVEIKNFAQEHTGTAQNGAALYLANGAKATLNAVNIHDNFSSDMGVIYATGAETRLHLTGACTFSNNALVKLNSGALKATYISDISNSAVENICISGDFTTPSLRFYNYSAMRGEGKAFATLEAGETLNAGANLIEVANTKLVGVANADSKLVWSTDTVTLIVNTKNGTEAFRYDHSLYVGDAIPTWTGTIWSYGESNTTTTKHVRGVKTYTANWLASSTIVALSSTDGGKTWSNWGSVWKPVQQTTAITHIEVIDDKALVGNDTDGTITIPAKAKYILDFNGFTVTRSAATVQFNVPAGTERNVTIKGANFDGKIGGEDVTATVPFVNMAGGAYGLTFEDCTFSNFKASHNASVIYAGIDTELTLKNVTMTNNVANQGAIRAGFDGNTLKSLKLHLDGEINLVCDTNYPTNKIYHVASISVGEDFSGNVHVYNFAQQQNRDVAASRDDYIQYATAAGQLASSWSYTNEGETLTTTKYVDGVKNYFKGEVVVDAEAYIEGNTYGDIVDVAKAAKAGDVIEIIKDTTTEGITISVNVTVNGNDRVLTITPSGTKHLLTISGAVTATINDLTLHGGSKDGVGVWSEAIAGKDVHLFLANDAGAVVTMNNLVITGQRNVATNKYQGGPLHIANGKFYFNDCQIVDNIMYSENGTDFSPVIRGSGDTLLMKFEGKCVVADNYAYGIGTGETKTFKTAGIYHGNVNRLVIGDLAEGSAIHLGTSGDYYALINPETQQPYDHAGMVFQDTEVVTEEGKAVLKFARSVLYCMDRAIVKATNGDDCVKIALVIDRAVDKTSVNGFAVIEADKFVLNIDIPFRANYSSDIVIKIGGIEKERIAFSDLAVKTYVGTSANNYYTIVTIPVAVGMAELSSNVTISIADTSISVTTSAKHYADTIISMSVEDFANAYTEDELIAMKSSLAALLQYGQMVQNFFGLNVPAAMTESDVAAWKAQGLTLALVEESTLNTESATGYVKAAVVEGTLPEGVVVSGATLTMENQISLRLYFTVDSTLDGLTFTANGEPVEPVTDTNTYQGMQFIEVSHIPTQNLAAESVFTISDGTNTYTYTASPMTYVCRVNEIAVGEYGVTDALKNACEALYYYYSAVNAYLGTSFDTTGFEILSYNTLNFAIDEVNTFSSPKTVA